MRRRFQAARWLSLPALLLLVGGLVVEIHIRGKEARARGSLGGALDRATLPNTAGEQVREMFNEVGALVRCENHSAALTLLDRIATQTPHFSLHVLAATVARASGEGDLATRHMQLAARLAPADAKLADRAEAALDTALLDQVRPFGRGGIALGGLSILWMLALAHGHRRDTRARRKFLDGITGRMKLVVDDRPGADVGMLTPGDGSLVVDVFLKGRYGMRPHPIPRSGPSLHLACSSASAGRTVRITPIHDVRGDAIRVQVTPETMRRLRAHPGRWRVQATLGDRRIAIAELNVLAA